MKLLVKRKEPVPSKAYDTFWHFAGERQRIFFSRLRGNPGPWTNDPVLSKYKFTNAFRAADRISQFLIQSVLYDKKYAPSEIFARCLLFKVFNRQNTWETIRGFVQDFPSARSIKSIIRALDTARRRGEKIFSAAYIMPAGAGRFCDSIKHRNFVHLVAAMIADNVPQKIQSAKCLADVFKLLRSFSLIGDFLAFQFAIDLNYSEIANFSEMEFVVPGPGAKRGIIKCFASFGDFSEAEIIRWTTERQTAEFQSRGISFETLWGRPLQLIDVQNLYCEIDKYTRVAEVQPNRNGRQKRPKQLFTPSSQVIHYFFPPKWGINSRIKKGADATSPKFSTVFTGATECE